MFVLVDTREKRSGIPDLLVNLGVPVRIQELEVGDYIVGDVVIERKSAEDFVQSIVDGRLPTQLYMMSANYQKAYLVVIGYITEALMDREIPRRTVISALVGASVKKAPDGVSGDVNVVMLESDWDFAYFIFYMWKKLENPEPRLPRHVKRSLEGDDELIYIVSSISGVGEKKAKALLEKFRTVQNIVNAPVPELMKVPGIGPRLATKIFHTVRREYKFKPRFFGR